MIRTSYHRSIHIHTDLCMHVYVDSGLALISRPMLDYAACGSWWLAISPKIGPRNVIVRDRRIIKARIPTCRYYREKSGYLEWSI